jgi:hypothetical protein
VERPSPDDAEDAIDAVVAWVDGRDPMHRRQPVPISGRSWRQWCAWAVASKERRFSDNDEIRFCLPVDSSPRTAGPCHLAGTRQSVPSAIDRCKAERHDIRVVDHGEICRGHEQLLPTFNSLAIETMLWRIDGLADRFLYLDDDMMFVGPVRRARTAGGFFSNEGEIMLPLDQLGQAAGEEHLYRQQQTAGRWNDGLHLGPFLLVQPRDLSTAATGDGELFEKLEPAFLANAAYRFRDRRQLWTISPHDHLLLKSNRAQVVKSHSSAHFSVRYCLSASPDALEARLKSLADGSVRMACINHLEAVVGKVVPDATRYLSEATGPAAPFEKRSSSPK